MTHEDAFLLDIVENREDDTPRRIFADWLLDQPDPVQVARGEFIHLQCELARQPVPELQARERALLEAHGREWGSLFRRLGCRGWEYRRGFVEGVGMPAASFLAQSATLVRSTPLRELKLSDASGVVADLAACSHLGRLAILDLECNGLVDVEVATLAGSAHLAGLETLLLWSNHAADDGARALAHSTGLPRLVRLDLSDNGVGDGGAEALAHGGLLARLSVLDLHGNQVSDRGAQALAATPHGGCLSWLDLAKNPIGADAQAALRQRYGGKVHVFG
jgi:uncharacterized protein (TIGR02996 family)